MNNKDQEIKHKLALAYQILAKLELDDHTYTHLSAKSSDSKSFYIYPFGLRFHEVTPDNLIQVTYAGEIIKGEEFQYNKTGYIIHGSIYENRQDINAIFHIHTPEIVAVSACADGLMPISQWALHFYGKLSYHNYDSLALDSSQGQDLINDLDENYNMLLRNHGSITSGRTIEEAMFYTYHLQQACKTQCLALSMNHKLTIPNEKTCAKTVKDLLSFEKNLGERDWMAWVNWLNSKNN